MGNTSDFAIVLRQKIINLMGEEGRAIVDEIDRRNAEKAKENATLSEMAARMQREEIDRYNDSVGTLTDGVDCKLCKNRGYIMIASGMGTVLRPCKCLTVRERNRRIEKSGMGEMIRAMKFENFIADEPYQAEMLRMAMEYSDGWLYVGGQVGCGKTHICTSVCAKLMEKLEPVRYMLWREEADEIKALANTTEYSDRLSELKSAETLYIDDFLKVKRGETPTAAEVRLAFELINARYIKRARTIISSEWHTDELLGIDEALGSRIVEMARGNIVNVRRENGRNYRLRRMTNE